MIGCANDLRRTLAAPQVEMVGDVPELPEAAFTLTWRNGAYRVDKPNIGTTDCYTDNQMRAYAQAALNARAGGDVLHSIVDQLKDRVFPNHECPCESAAVWNVALYEMQEAIDAALASQAVGVSDGN